LIVLFSNFCSDFQFTFWVSHFHFSSHMYSHFDFFFLLSLYFLLCCNTQQKSRLFYNHGTMAAVACSHDYELYKPSMLIHSGDKYGYVIETEERRRQKGRKATAENFYFNLLFLCVFFFYLFWSLSTDFNFFFSMLNTNWLMIGNIGNRIFGWSIL
jgi:hypothetical protein